MITIVHIFLKLLAQQLMPIDGHTLLGLNEEISSAVVLPHLFLQQGQEVETPTVEI